MGLITSPVPEIGSPNASEQVDTTNLLTEIKNLLNGSLDTTNLSVALRDLVAPPVVTALPSSPTDGARVRLRLAEGVLSPLRYNAASSSAYKWEADGVGVMLTSGNFTGGTPVNFTGLSSLTVPLTGEYDVSADMEINENDPDGSAALVIRQGTTTVAELASQRRYTPGAHLVSRPRVVTLQAATVYTLTAYRQSGGSIYRSEWGLRPRRVG